MSAPTVAIPARRWGDEPRQPAPAPVVLVSSRDGADVPHVAGAARLAAAARAAGWTVLQQYALADVPDGWPAAVSKAHRRASVAVLLARRGHRGWAVWASRDGGKWTFDSAQMDGRALGARALTAALVAVSHG